MATTPTLQPADPQLEEFEEAWDGFFASVRRARGRAAKRADEDGLTLAQYQLIAAFQDREEIPVGELAELGGVATPTATRMLGCLERDGIVDRHKPAEDRRRVVVSLTPRGRRALQAKRREVSAARRRIFDSLHPDERREAAHLLVRLARMIDEL